MEWNSAAKEKFDNMLSMIPFFQRKMAERLAGKKAAENAAVRGSKSVEEEDIVKAFVSETPAPFQATMRETAARAGFDMPA